jgi:hypothetical protein
MTATTSKLGADMTDDTIDAVSKALRRAWQLGQTYWQQADSDSYKQQDKSDETRKKFEALVDETRAILARQPAAIDKEADDDIEEAREILKNMVRSIELDGNYSTEATCTFLRQALNCLPVAAPLANEASKPAAPGMTNGDFHCPACGEAMKGPTFCGSCLWEADTCGYRSTAAPSVEQDERGACIHADEPKACYRVRCQLGNKCVDDDMSPRAASPATPSVAQDERRRFSSADEFDKWAAASEERADQGERAAFVKLMGYDLPTVDGAAKDVWEGQRTTWLEALEFAASTSANVAQGAEPSAYRTLLDSLGYPWLPCPICNGTEGCDHSYPERARAALAAPPAQTASEDDARDVKLEALNILHELSAVKRYSLQHHAASKGRTSSTLNVPNELLARIDALTAGDTK